MESLAARRQTRLQAEEELTGEPMMPQRVYPELNKVLPRDCMVTIDAGVATGLAYDRLRFYEPRTMFNYAGQGGLGLRDSFLAVALVQDPIAPLGQSIALLRAEALRLRVEDEEIGNDASLAAARRESQEEVRLFAVAGGERFAVQPAQFFEHAATHRITETVQ